MPYPLYSQITDPLLSLIYFRGGSDFKVKCSDTYRPLADYFQLTEQERQILWTSEGNERKRKWDTMVCYARRELKKSGYLSSNSSRSIWQLSSSGITAAQKVSLNYKELQNGVNTNRSKQIIVEPKLPDQLQPISSSEPAQNTFTVTEGREKLAIHIERERNPKIIKQKKKRILSETGKLSCEVCKFDFVSRYGDLGNEFCEVHHKNPLAKVDNETQTSLEDLAIVCANCHRMIHHSQCIQPTMMSIEQLKSILKNLDGIE
jgi:5-methylcytosine-specific restriction endonuclease McrA